MRTTRSPVFGGRADRRRPQRVVSILAATAVVALVGAIGIVRLYSEEQSIHIADQEQRAKIADEKVAVWTLAAFVPKGTSLEGVAVKQSFWPRSLPQDVVLDQGELVGKYAAVDLHPGVPIKAGDITNSRDSTPLTLTSGNRAVSIEVDATAGVEGHATPGTRVDVILTYYEEGSLTSKVIVENARVISVAGDNTPGGDRRRTISRRSGKHTMTLDVSPQAALKIQTARQLGRLSLTMRADSDHVSSPVQEVTGLDLSSLNKKVADQPSCVKGVARISGERYQIACDGSLVPMKEAPRS